MQSIELKSHDNRIVLDMDASIVDYEALFRFMGTLQVETLAKQIDFDEGILKLADELKSHWWAENKSKFVKD